MFANSLSEMNFRQLICMIVTVQPGFWVSRVQPKFKFVGLQLTLRVLLVGPNLSLGNHIDDISLIFLRGGQRG